MSHDFSCIRTGISGLGTTALRQRARAEKNAVLEMGAWDGEGSPSLNRARGTRYKTLLRLVVQRWTFTIKPISIALLGKRSIKIVENVTGDTRSHTQKLAESKLRAVRGIMAEPTSASTPRLLT